MDLSDATIKKILSKYKFRDLTIEELQTIHKTNARLQPSVETYTFNDTSQKDLLKLTGTIPVNYQGRSYNIPIQLWLLDSYPFTPPICFLMPTPEMVIWEGKHVDSQGRIYLPYLKDWNYPKSTIIGLISEMIQKFEEDPPLRSKSAKDDQDAAKIQTVLSKISGGVSNINLHSPTKVNEQKTNQPLRKVTVIGAGDLSIACVTSILAKGQVDKLIFIDTPESSNKGGTSDLEMFLSPKVEICTDFAASAGSMVVAVMANAWSNEQSYLNVVQANVDLFRTIIPNVARHNPNGVLLIASQPVDIMTCVAWKLSGLPPNQVIGIGCNLDSQRLQRLLSNSTKLLPGEKQAWVIGELSENNVIAWSGADISKDNQAEVIPGSAPLRRLTDRALEILKGRGHRSSSVGLSVADVVHSILLDQRHVHSISTLAKGWCGFNAKVFFSLPCVIGASGVIDKCKISLEEEEADNIRKSAASLHSILEQLTV
ncbi:ubiquitin-conjugating enzyme E2 variant 3 [Polypterus senegalus]|uniref:ubiquitin-conjugating enzyme E2 variant 3 n=1 Tax=Polypterus senegalus TaxID=55291 RepID=UPI001963832E|nr:ubiquitin-conjugating enzyme E2 variant 3 [Polypterus senegalus]